MRHLERRKVRWASGDEGEARQHQPSTEEGRRRREQEERGKKNTNLDDLVLKLMAIVGCCRNLTALRGPPSTINTVPDINNNT